MALIIGTGRNAAGGGQGSSSYVIAWDGASTPDVSQIPAGVTVTFNDRDYTGILAADKTLAKENNIYIVPSATQEGEWDRYVIVQDGDGYAWQAIGSTQIVSPVIADNLTTNDPSKALSAAQGVVLDKKIEGRSNISVYASADGWKLTGDGLCAEGTNVRLRKYLVTPGKLIYLKLSKDTEGVYQFQDAASVPSYGTNSHLIGDPIATATDELLIVPTGASCLVVSESSSNTTNIVQMSLQENIIDPIKYDVEILKEQNLNARLSIAEGDIGNLDKTINGESLDVSITLSDIGIAKTDNYMHLTGHVEASSNTVISNPIYLKEGDIISCATGGTGFALFFRLSNGDPITQSTQASEVIATANSGTVVTYSRALGSGEDGWYAFSGRSNRIDGTNLIVVITRAVQTESVDEKINKKADKNEIIGGFGLISLSVGADSVKDSIPDSPWFNSEPGDGTTYGNYLDDKIDSIPFGDSFIFITDVHYTDNRKQSASLLDYVRRRAGIKTIIHGGDVENEATTIAGAAAQWLDFNRDYVFRMGGDFKQVVGDHDHNGGAGHENLPYQFIQRMVTGYNAKELVFDNLYDEEVAALNWSSSDMEQYDALKRMHYYFDDLTIRTRFVVLMTGWTGESGLAVDKLGIGALDEPNALYLQQDFIYNALMTLPQGFNIVVVGHNVIGNPGVAGQVNRYDTSTPIYKGAWRQVNTHIAAFKKKKDTQGLIYRTWSMAQTGYKHFDYSNAPDANVILCLGGDVHWDILAKAAMSNSDLSNVTSGSSISTDDYILNAVTMTDSQDRGYRDANGDLICNPATAGTIDSQAFDIVTLSKDAIYFTRIGSGNDRVVYFNP